MGFKANVSSLPLIGKGLKQSRNLFKTRVIRGSELTWLKAPEETARIGTALVRLPKQSQKFPVMVCLLVRFMDIQTQQLFHIISSLCNKHKVPCNALVKKWILLWSRLAVCCTLL